MKWRENKARLLDEQSGTLEGRGSLRRIGMLQKSPVDGELLLFCHPLLELLP